MSSGTTDPQKGSILPTYSKSGSVRNTSWPMPYAPYACGRPSGAAQTLGHELDTVLRSIERLRDQARLRSAENDKDDYIAAAQYHAGETAAYGDVVIRLRDLSERL
jgi:hypothetical protein